MIDLDGLSAFELRRLEHILRALPRDAALDTLPWEGIAQSLQARVAPVGTVAATLAQIDALNAARRARGELEARLAVVSRNLLAAREPPTPRELRQIRRELAARFTKMFPTRDWPHIMEHGSP